MRNGYWTECRISQWHKKVFPDVTVAEQRQKAGREAAEYMAARKTAAKLEEAADFFIVNAVLARRFSDPVGRLTVLMMKSLPEFDEIAATVEAKMAVNVNRSWQKIRGEWRHVEKNNRA